MRSATVCGLSERMVHGIQLSVFEVLWPSVVTLDALFIRSKPSGFDFYFRFNQAPSADERETCIRLMGEIVEAAYPGRKRQVRYLFGTSAPMGNFRELMSCRLFERIAEVHAPWRLRTGR
jgi:hypothetical protein